MATKPKLRGMVLHNDRFRRHLGGMTVEAIARQDAVAESTVKSSIEAVHAYRALCKDAEVEIVQNDTIIANAEEQKRVLGEALRATKLVKSGKKWVEVPDWDVRMRAMELFPELITAVKPKGGGHMTQVNVQAVANNNDNTTVATGKGADSFEDVLRRVTAQKALEAGEPPPSEFVIDAEVPDGSPPSG